MITLNSNIDGYSLATINKIDYAQDIVIFHLLEETTNEENETVYSVADRNRYIRILDFPFDLTLLTEEQLADIKIVNNTLERAKASKTAEIQTAYDNAIKAGYHDSALNITIRISDSDRNQFNQRITLLSLIPAEQMPTHTTVKDINNDLHSLTLEQFYSLMLNMGGYYDTQIWANKSIKDKAIEQATTIEEVNAITY